MPRRSPTVRTPRPSPGDNPGRGADLAQALTVLRLLLSPGRHLVQDVADTCGLSRRQAYRLLDGLEAAGVRLHRLREGVYVYLRADEDSVLRLLGLRR